jgi:hypothetical protein
MNISMKIHGISVLTMLLAGVFLAGCVPTAQHNAAWPWNTKNDYDMKQTGDFIGATAGVVQFGDAPKPVRLVEPETNGLSQVEKTAAYLPVAKVKTEIDAFSASPIPTSFSEKLIPAATGYDFSLQVISVALPSSLSDHSYKSDYSVAAFNRGPAPVSVAFDIDGPSHENWAADIPLPLFTVVPPYSEMIVARLAPKSLRDSGGIRSLYSWTLGGKNASHLAPEHYQFPFPKDVKASASILTGRVASSDRHAVIFVMPVHTPVLAARKGTVVRIKGTSKVDVLHDDSTIGTYEHLGDINRDISVGVVVSTETKIGTVGGLGKEKEGYLRLTVWRPEPQPPALPRAGSSNPGFDVISLPMEFCSPNFKGCKTLRDDQPVSRGILGGRKKL